MTKIYDIELLEDRAAELESNGYNGIDRIFMSIDTVSDPAFAVLNVEFFNNLFLADILTRINVDGVPVINVFKIEGGTRIPAGDAPGQVQVTAASAGSAENIIDLTVRPIGDYSTYTLIVEHVDVVLGGDNNVIPDGDGNPLVESKIDPLFASRDFKFRPGCFNTNCAPGGTYEAPDPEPVIDYLAKDFESFKHVMINAMRVRVPDWQPTSEADLDQVLIDLIAADADELSDYQDRVMNEAYLGRARKRVSLARHARLMDYHIHQGNQASTRLALQMLADDLIAKGFGVWTSDSWQAENAIIFVSTDSQHCFTALNELNLYTWGGVVTALEAESVKADLVPSGGTTKIAAEELLNIVRRNDVTALLLEEKINPETGRKNGRNKTAGQLLRLLDGSNCAELVHDPIADKWLVRVFWEAEDKLRQRYCFAIQCSGQIAQEGISAFHGNLLKVSHGRPHSTVFKAPNAELNPSDNSQLVRTDEAWFELPLEERWGTLCRLPHPLLAYKNTAPGGDTPPISSLEVEVDGISGFWTEQGGDLIESEPDDLHFLVETDEYDRSVIRFGNNVNGRALPPETEVTCRYQIGRGSLGNVGADTLTGFDQSVTGFPNVGQVWNPFDVTNGRGPEKSAEIIRRVPQAYRARQLRAVTLEDYANRAEELPGVSHAHARYGWTGSWRTVRVAIDPKGTNVLSSELRDQIFAHLDAVRLIGEDLEIRCARYASLDIFIKLCAHPHFWQEDLAHELETEFSDGYTADGRMGFFHPDLWTFGQSLHASQLIGRAMRITGVDRVLLVSVRRWYQGSGLGAAVIYINPEDLPVDETQILEVAANEVIQVANDPSHLERGRIQFDVVGGRQ